MRNILDALFVELKHCMVLCHMFSKVIIIILIISIITLHIIIILYWIGGLQIVLQDVAFLLIRASFPPHFQKTVVEMKALGLPHVLKLWLGVKKSHAPYKTPLL